MSIYQEIDSKLLKLCDEFFVVSDEHLEDLCKEISNMAFQIVSLEDKRLEELVASVYTTFDVFWYFYGMDIKTTKEGYLNIRKEIRPYIEQIQHEVIK